jgi:hypothetical protein
MIRGMRVLALAILSVGLLGCRKPTEEDCRQAVLNLQKLRGVENTPQAPDPEPAVRRCRSTGDIETVKCLIAAKTAADIDVCQKKE